MDLPVLSVRFFRTRQGVEPVREWLKSLPAAERKAIGDEIRTMQFAWPVGMPLVRKIEPGLWEVRVRMADRIARVLLTIIDGNAILLHAFIKKSQKIAHSDLDTARRRKDLLKDFD